MSLKISKRIQRGNIAFYKSKLLSWNTFEEHVEQVRNNILKHSGALETKNTKPKVINLCEDKYHFLVAFTATMLEGSVTVMPSNRSEGELARMIKGNQNTQIIDDAQMAEICQSNTLSADYCHNIDLNSITHSMIVAELYSSGSDGISRVSPKTWGQLINGAQQVYASYKLDDLIQLGVIATVPPQHMFGFEMSVVMALVCGVIIHHDQPFYPLDIQRALNDMPAPRIMVTTPIHLKACNTLNSGWPDIAFILSATAPLSEQVAQQAEDIMQCEVREIYGCSEVGAIATRRMIQDTNWKLLSGYSLSINKQQALLQIPSKNKPIPLPDSIKILPDNFFRLLGRNTDLIKIGGKRGSLAEIAMHIKKIPGVKDAVVFNPAQEGSQRVRLAALVVASGMTCEQLREAILFNIDPVFMPRPILFVSELPYNSIGKLPRADLLACLNINVSETKPC